MSGARGGTRPDGRPLRRVRPPRIPVKLSTQPPNGTSSFIKMRSFPRLHDCSSYAINHSRIIITTSVQSLPSVSDCAILPPIFSHGASLSPNAEILHCTVAVGTQGKRSGRTPSPRYRVFRSPWVLGKTVSSNCSSRQSRDPSVPDWTRAVRCACVTTIGEVPSTSPPSLVNLSCLPCRRKHPAYL